MTWSLAELEAEFDRWSQQEMDGNVGADITSVAATRRFLDWLVSDAGNRPSSRRSARGYSRTPAPAALYALVSRWRAAGEPSQSPIPWPWRRWIEAFPAYRETLEALPTRLDRSTLREHGSAAVDGPHAAEATFLAVMAWGFGNVGYGPFRAKRILTSTPEAAGRLHIVAQTLAESGATEAYRRLGDADDCRLSFFGPAFGTKFLYFCQPEGQEMRALIHDDLMSTWIRRESGVDVTTTAWSESKYRTYLDLMHQWALALECLPEAIEYVIFQAMADERGNQWGS